MRLHGHQHPFTAIDLKYIGLALLRQGKIVEAEKCLRESLEVSEKMEAKTTISQAETHSILGEILTRQGKLDEAETHCRAAVTIAKQQMGEDYLDLPMLLSALADVLAQRGKLVEARQYAAQAVDICNRHPDEVARSQKDAGDGRTKQCPHQTWRPCPRTRKIESSAIVLFSAKPQISKMGTWVRPIRDVSLRQERYLMQMALNMNSNAPPAYRRSAGLFIPVPTALCTCLFTAAGNAWAKPTGQPEPPIGSFPAIGVPGFPIRPSPPMSTMVAPPVCSLQAPPRIT